MANTRNVTRGAHRPRMLRRLVWFVCLWAASVACVAALGAVLRLWLGMG